MYNVIKFCVQTILYIHINRAGLRRCICGPNIAVLCKTCSVLLCVFEHLRVGAGPKWEQLVQLA